MKKDDKDYQRLIHDETQKNDTLNQDEISNRVLSLFKYIQEINKLKQKTILNVNVTGQSPSVSANIGLF